MNQVGAVVLEWWPDETAAPHQLSAVQNCLQQGVCGKPAVAQSVTALAEK